MSLWSKSVAKPVTTALVFIAFAIFGVFSLMNTSIAQLPEMEANTIMVMSSYQGASAADIEQNLTKILENSLNGVANLKTLASNSKENISIVFLEFEQGTDIDEATNDVRDKLDMVNSQLPDGASLPFLFKFSADDMPIMILSATAAESLPGLDKILEDKLVTPLARVSGVGTVSVTGAPTREIQVYCDPAKLQAYGLSTSQIAQVIAAENRNMPSGYIDIGTETYSLRVQKEFDDPSELLDVVVGASKTGSAVYLRDVAQVRDGSQEREQESFTNGIRSAQIIIQKQNGANTVDVINEINRKLAAIQETLPSDIGIQTVIDSSENINNTIRSLKDTILITFLVVMLVVFVFLGRWRATFIIVLSIPIALLASLVYLFATGNTLNIVSMSALSIAIGMVVDDAIVVLENISSHLEQGEDTKTAAVNATGEVAISVIASTLTMLCVFLPLTLVKGMTGVMFKQLGWIVSIIMIVSTSAALTLVPMLCSRMLKSGPKTGKLHLAIFGPVNRFLDWISRGYARLIGWATTHRKPVILGSIAIFIASIVFLAPGIKTEFFPHSDDGRLSLTIELPMGTAQTTTAEVAAGIYNDIRQAVPEIKIMSYNFGQADSDNAYASMQSNGTHLIKMNINVGSKTTRKRSVSDIADVIRGIYRNYPEIKKGLVQEGGGMMGGASSVKVEVYGYDFAQTDDVALQIKSKLLQNPAFSQVTLSRDEYCPEYQMDFDRTKLALNGLTSATAGAAFSAAMSGSVASFYREDGEEYYIRVRYAPEFRTSIEDLENIVVYNSAGKAVRMKELGNVIETSVPPTIERKNRSRYVSVNGIVSQGAALSDAVAVTQKCLSEIDIPTEISAVIAGDYEDQQEMFGDMFVLIVLMIILVYMVMASQFESFVSPFVIMFSVPFALTGVMLGLSVTGTALGVMGLIGIIILLGIVVKNGIVLIDCTNLWRSRGKSAVEASVIAARSRLRPILMTTLTTVLGMVPLAIGTGEGAEMWRSLGMTVCWGLSISTLVTLVLIPSVYCVFATRAERRASLKKKQA